MSGGNSFHLIINNVYVISLLINKKLIVLKTLVKKQNLRNKSGD